MEVALPRHYDKRRMRHLAAAVLLAGCAPAAADVLVVRATGPSAKSYPPGRSLPDEAAITLKANDQLVVLDSKGTRTLRGPGTFKPSAPAQIAAGTTLRALAGQRQRQARVGAVRGPGTSAPRPFTIWHVDVSKSSNVCIADANSVILWRADASAPVELTITRVRDGVSREVTWAAGQPTLAWPSDLPILESDDYRLTWSASTIPTTFKFRTVAPAPPSIEGVTSSLIKNGCAAQLDLLIDTVKLADSPTAPPAG
jgi:hypothetical protein